MSGPERLPPSFLGWWGGSTAAKRHIPHGNRREAASARAWMPGLGCPGRSADAPCRSENMRYGTQAVTESAEFLCAITAVFRTDTAKRLSSGPDSPRQDAARMPAGGAPETLIPAGWQLFRRDHDRPAPGHQKQDGPAAGRNTESRPGGPA